MFDVKSEIMKKMKEYISPYVFAGLKTTEEKFLSQVMYERNRNKSTSHEEVLKVVSEEFGVTMEGIISKSRKKELVNARFAFFAALRIKMNINLTEIGKITSSRDHTSIIHGLQEFKNRYDTEDEFKKTVSRIFGMLNIKYNGEKLTESQYKYK